jgi:MFS family permease
MNSEQGTSRPVGEPRRGRVLGPLYAAGFVTAFAAHSVAANLGGYAAGRHASLVELGVLLAIYDGAEVVLKPAFGVLADRVGPRPVLLGGLVGFALASALFVLAGEPDLLGGARLLQGAAAAAFSPAASALVAHAGGGKDRGRSFGGYGAAKGLGYLAGPLVGGLLVAVGGYRLLFTVLAGLAIAVAVLVAHLVPTTGPTTVTSRPRETIAGLVRRLSSPNFLGPVAILAAATAALSAGVGFLPVVGARGHLGPVATGAVVSLLAACAALAQPQAGRALDAGQIPARSASWGLLAAAAGLALTAVLRGPFALAGAAILIGIGVGVATPLGFAALAEAAPPGRMGQTMGAAEVGRELGDAGGPLLIGALSIAGLGVGFAGLAVVILGAAIGTQTFGSMRPR